MPSKPIKVVNTIYYIVKNIYYLQPFSTKKKGNYFELRGYEKKQGVNKFYFSL